MKKIVIYIMAVLLCVSTSCERRPLTVADYTVTVNITIDKDIVNYEMTREPSLMRCIFYDSESGAFITQAFLPPTGGDVSLIPARSYDVLVYNFDTESTWIEDENWFGNIYASTSLIPDSFRTKLRSRSTKTDEESIVYDPDHLFVANSDELIIPYSETVDTLRATDGKPYFYAESIVKSYYLQVRVRGAQYISSAVSLLEGMSGSINLQNRELNLDRPVTVYFEMISDKATERTSDEEAIIYTTFGIFGRIEEMVSMLEVTFDFMTTYGVPFSATLDISADFETPEAINNQWLLLDDIITIPEPPPSTGGGGSGGFTPSVDQWSDVESDIVI